MQRLVRVFMGVVLGAMASAAAEDHWATTYHVVSDPQGDGLTIMPIRFLTYHSSPETEVNAVSEPNHLDLRANSLTQDANLTSLYGIKVRVIHHSVATGTVVLVDLSSVRTPTNQVNPPSKEAVVSNTVACVVSAAKNVTGGRLEIRIKAPDREDGSRWQKFAKILDLKKEDDR